LQVPTVASQAYGEQSLFAPVVQVLGAVQVEALVVRPEAPLQEAGAQTVPTA
jgi:hypothetical protein